eukprot:CAMPEP_0116144914 /NCGR_PEP_ID=MMETSP0329-20121206/16286_1 /TAXON_ID=697910 /ORGANISM="Pseudo-nitzschia arenysensis, Strain B593" /LENGTH=525 /DNA_ID=CAMNT_0003640429 /DNA_START=210 /DNA_END=1788 /DNA_ORIENTATION=+
MNGHNHNNDDDGDCSCPICLESMTVSERKIYPLVCQQCDFNFCSNCVENFCKAAEDDFQIASDGSRQVKVHVSCPQCRSKYPLDDLEDTVLLLRSAHALAESIMVAVQENRDNNKNSSTTSSSTTTSNSGVEETKEESGCHSNPGTKYRLLRDSDLSASQLAKKMEFASNEAREQLKDASALYEHAMDKAMAQRKDVDEETQKIHKKQREKAKEKWTQLLDQLPAEPSNACQCGEDVDFCDGSCGSRNSIEVVLQNTSSYSSTPSPRKSAVDETLFQGFDEFMNKDEKLFLTDLFTDGDVRSVAQAALIMNGVRRLALTGKHKTIREESLSKQELQQKIDRIDQMKVRFPLPNHMPGYFLIPTYSYREGYMTLKQKPWDGTMTPPQRSKRVFEKVYAKSYTRPRPKSEYPISVATVQAVRGPIGRLGLRRDDIITHVEDAEWHGTAEDLQNYIYECHAKHPKNEISITVNATPETCEFLRVRNEMIMRSLREEASRKKQQALVENSNNSKNNKHKKIDDNLEKKL